MRSMQKSQHTEKRTRQNKNEVFYEVVMAAQDREHAYLATGNLKHFPVKSFIVTPREMLEIIQNDQS